MGLVRLLIDHLCCYRDDHITSNQVAKFTMPLQVNEEARCKSAVNTARDELDLLVFKKIPQIPQDELKDIVVNTKWFASVEDQIIEEIERVTQSLANRVKTLEHRYAKTLPTLSKDVNKYTNLVEDHLKKMGLSW